MREIRIAERTIGPGAPCFLVAEIGINHNGDIELAKKTIDAAVTAGADAVKFQSYRTEDFISDKSLMHTYVSQEKTIVESQYEMFKRHELAKESIHELKNYSERQGILFHSTPTSEDGIMHLVKMGVPVLKNGSDYLTHLPLIEAMGKSGLPTVISTGMATLAEIEDAVRTFRKTGNNQLILLHCSSSYPTPLQDVHLRKIPALASIFGCLVGFSDHTVGIVAAIGAVAMGACWIEKHFTLGKNLSGPDHHFSADQAEFRAMVDAVRTFEKCLGDSSIGPAASEIQCRLDFRLSCTAAHPLQRGHSLTANDIVFCRPGTGLAPALSHLLLGATLKRNVKAGEIFQLGDVE